MAQNESTWHGYWVSCAMLNQSANGNRFGNCLPGTELLQTPFRTEFRMGSLSLRYRRSLRYHRRFLRSYLWSLRHCCEPSCLEKVPISPWLVTLLHICGVTPTPQSPISPKTPRDRRQRRRLRIECRCLRIERRYRRIEWRVFKCFLMFHNVLRVSWCFTSGSQCITMFYMCFMMFYYVLHVSWCFTMFTCVSWCFTMFNNILWCSASRATIGDRANAAGISDNSAEIGDNSAEIGDDAAEIGDDAAGIVDIAAKVITCWTPSWMETGVTLFLEEKFQTCEPWGDRRQRDSLEEEHTSGTNISFCSVSSQKIIYIIIIKNPPKFTWYAK